MCERLPFESKGLSSLRRATRVSTCTVTESHVAGVLSCLGRWSLVTWMYQVSVSDANVFSDSSTW